MSYKNKRILGIGAASEPRLREAAIGGADYIELIPFSESESMSSDLIEWTKSYASDAIVGLRNITAFTLEDEQEFDHVFVGSIAEVEFRAVSDNIIRAIKRGGELTWMKPDPKLTRHSSVPGDDRAPLKLSIPPTAPVQSREAKRGPMLHVHNVQRCGGTGNFVFDMATCFPEFHHHALCVNDANGDPQWCNDVSSVMRTFYSPTLTQEMLDEIDPRIVVLHATAGRSLEGDWPYDWLQDGGRRYVIFVHHTTTYPLLNADLDVFVSKHLRDYYSKIIERCSKPILMPPCMNLAPLSALPIKVGEPRYTSAGKHCDQLLSFARQQGLELHTSPPGRIGAMTNYLRDFNSAIIWSGHKETWCRTLTECMAAGLLVIGHNSGAIPEQIEDGVNGFLFNDESELGATLEKVAALSDSARLEIRKTGREWALKNASLTRMRETLYPYIANALVTS